MSAQNKSLIPGCISVKGNDQMNIIMSTPLGGGHIIFAFSAVQRPASHLVSRHFRQQFFSYLYQIWHAGLLG